MQYVISSPNLPRISLRLDKAGFTWGVRFDANSNLLGVFDVSAPILVCPSSDNLGHQSGFCFGGSGSSMIDFMRLQFGGASAA